MIHTNSINEVDLLLRLRDGNESAFADLYQRYSGRIYGNLLKLVKDREAAQELLQELFVKIWENRRMIRIESSFSAYLFATSRHMVYNYMRHLLVAQKAEARLARTQSELYQHVEEGVRYRELEESIRKAIEALPPQRQRIYRLCKLEGKSYDEVSSMLGISTATINDHIVKATRFLKKRLTHSGHLTIVAVIANCLIVRWLG